MKWAMFLCAILSIIAYAAGVDDRFFIASFVFEAAYAICSEIEKTRTGGDHDG